MATVPYDGSCTRTRGLPGSKRSRRTVWWPWPSWTRTTRSPAGVGRRGCARRGSAPIGTSSGATLSTGKRVEPSQLRVTAPGRRRRQMCHFQGGGGTSRGKRKKKKKKIKSTGFSQFSAVLSTSTVPVQSTSLQSTFSRGNRATTPGESSFIVKTTDRSRAERRYQHRLARRSRQRSARKAARVLASRTEEAKATGDLARSPDRVSHRRSKEARVARRSRQRRRQLYEQIRQKTVAKLMQFVNLHGGTDYNEATPKIPAD